MVGDLPAEIVEAKGSETHNEPRENDLGGIHIL